MADSTKPQALAISSTATRYTNPTVVGLPAKECRAVQVSPATIESDASDRQPILPTAVHCSGFARLPRRGPKKMADAHPPDDRPLCVVGTYCSVVRTRGPSLSRKSLVALWSYY